MNVPCPIHGSRRAHRGCFHCRRPICRLCEIRMRGHLYCSEKCARGGGRAELAARIRARLGRPVPARLAVLAVLFACSAPAVFALRTVAELERLNAPTALSPPRRPPLARVERVIPGPLGARIEGTAPPGTAVFLFAGGQFAATAVAPDGRFQFDNIKASGPYRVGALPLGGATAPADAGPPATGAAPAPAASASLPAARAVPAPAPYTSLPPAEREIRRAAVPDLTHGPGDRREVLVSFDAGSSDRGAKEILDALRAHQIRTTIFLTGEFIRRYPDLARRIAADGHEVGNHTETHPHLTSYARDGRQATREGVDRAFLVAQLSRTARLYEETTGKKLANIWRAPFGEHNEEIRRWAAQAGYWHVGWTGGRAGLDGLDWVADPRSPVYRTSAKVVSSLVERAENGGIVLLHLGSDRDDPVAPRIPALLDGLAARGFRFAQATEFLDREGLTEQRLAALAAPGSVPALPAAASGPSPR